MISNERGIALIITLLVVSLLAITVVEFTESVEVDQRMARNALNGVQATLLARSGINLGEAFLLKDNIQSQFDAFTEDWCPTAGPDAQSCLIDESNSQVVVPENMRLRVQILDEGAKFNVNFTRPNTTQQWQQWHDNPSTPTALTVFERLCQARGVDLHISDALMDYWHNALAAADQAVAGSAPGATPGPTTGSTIGPTPGAPLSPQAANQQRNQILAQIWEQYEFHSLDDLGVIAGLTPSAINRLRPVLTAERQRGQVNINTAPRAVLNAILDDPNAADNIISQRQNGPLQNAQMAQQAQQPGVPRVPIPMGVQSQLFLVRASAIVNPDPLTGRGGIRRSASMLVQRVKAVGGPTGGSNTGAGGQHWTLRRLDWQKEGGAVLFQPRVDGEPGTDDTTSPMAPDSSGWMTN